MALPRPDRIDALLLDLDDTILDDRSGIRGAWDAVVEVAREQRPDLEAEGLREAIAATTGWYWSDPERERRGRLDLLRARVEIVAGALERLGLRDAALAEACARRYTEHRERSYRLADGAWDALRRLRRALPRMAVVTNGATRPQRAKLDRFRLVQYFDHVQVEGEFGLGKPEPAVYRHVAASLAVEPERCLMVGDNYRCDVVGALAVGMHAAWVDVEATGRPPGPAPRPHATVRSLRELADRLLSGGAQDAQER